MSDVAANILFITSYISSSEIQLLQNFLFSLRAISVSHTNSTAVRDAVRGRPSLDRVPNFLRKLRPDSGKPRCAQVPDLAKDRRQFPPVHSEPMSSWVVLLIKLMFSFCVV